MTTWLHRIVVNACLDRLRRAKARPTVPLPEHDSAHPVEPSDPLGRRELAWEIDRALRTLPDDQRAALVLVDVEGYSVDETAALLGIPTGTVKSRCARGRAKLVPLLTHLRNRPEPDDVPLSGDAVQALETTHRRARPASSRRPAMSQHHDPVHPDSDHLTAEVLADLELGLLDDESRDHAELHLSHCAACTAIRGDLAALTDAMSGLPTNRCRTPSGSSSRQALAAEPVVTPDGAATVVPLEAARSAGGAGPGSAWLLVPLAWPFLARSSSRASWGSNESTTASDSGGPTASGDTAMEVPTTAFAATQSGTKYQEAALDSQVTQLVAARATVHPDTAAHPRSGDGFGEPISQRRQLSGAIRPRNRRMAATTPRTDGHRPGRGAGLPGGLPRCQGC